MHSICYACKLWCSMSIGRFCPLHAMCCSYMTCEVESSGSLLNQLTLSYVLSVMRVCAAEVCEGTPSFARFADDNRAVPSKTYGGYAYAIAQGADGKSHGCQ